MEFQSDFVGNRIAVKFDKCTQVVTFALLNARFIRLSSLFLPVGVTFAMIPLTVSKWNEWLGTEYFAAKHTHRERKRWIKKTGETSKQVRVSLCLHVMLWWMGEMKKPDRNVTMGRDEKPESTHSSSHTCKNQKSNSTLKKKKKTRAYKTKRNVHTTCK